MSIQKPQISPISTVSTNSNVPPPPTRAITLDGSNKRDIKKISQLDINLPTSQSSLESRIESSAEDLESSDGNEEEEDDDNQFVEFDLGGDKSGIISNKIKNNSTAELIKYGKGNKTSSSLNVSSQKKVITKVPSPKTTPIKNNNINLDDDNDVLLSSDSEDDLDWRQMSTELDLEMYNEKGELIANSEIFLQDNKEQLEDGSKLGYTRIAAEEQVAKFNKMNEEFEFLFNTKDNDKLRDKNQKITDDKVYFNIDDIQNHNSKEDLSLHKNEELSTLTQLNSTKEMLKDSQKIAYVGLVKLIIVDMAINLSKLTLNNSSIKLNKKMSVSHLNFQQWSIKMMDRLYDHMELSDNERRMIETLSSHGLEPKDLIPSLITIETLQNPLLNNNKEDETQFIKTGEEDELANEFLKVDIKWTLICDLFLNLIFDAIYDARSRHLLLKFGESLGIPNLEIFQFERRITDLLEIEESSEQIWNEQEILQFRLKSNKKKKMVYIGLATLGGSLVIGLSAGLLAPVIGAGIAAGLTTIGISGTSGFLAGVGGTSIVTTVGVLSGASIGSRGMLKRVGNVKTFEFRPIHNNRRVNLILTVSGWMNGNEDDVRLPFSTVDPVMGDIYSLLWEPEMLKSTGQTINILATEILTQSIQQILGSTVLIAFMASVQWPMMLSKLGYLLDNPWNVSLDRAWAAGIILADTLVQRNLGVRPVTLVGFSLGARVIYSCLLELNKRGAYGLVQDVILFGSPVVFKHDQISLCRTVVSGHFVNGYSKRDWILGYLFRATSGGLATVAGLTSIEGVEGVENFDCTEFVNGHMEYRKQIPKLLKELGWEILNEEFVEIDEPENLERQRELIHEFENVKDELDNNQGKGKGKKNFFTKWFKPQKKEWWEVYDEGRREVEQKQKQEQKNGKQKEEDTEDEEGKLEEQVSGGEELFNIDEIAREVARLEAIAEADKTPIVQQNEEFQPRSFKTKSVDSTPVQEFIPRPFKSPSSSHNNHNDDFLKKQKTSMLLQKIILADDETAHKDGEDKSDDKTEESQDLEPVPHSSYYDDDDDEFNNTGQEIKMSFA